MEDKYGYEYESMCRVITASSKYPDELTANPGLAAMIAKLQTQKEAAQKSLIKLDISTQANTKEGIAIREQSALSFSIASNIASGYGTGNQVADLINLSRFTYSALRYSSTVNQIIDSEKILDVTGGYAVVLANNGLDAAFVTLLHDDLAKLKTLTAIPKEMIEQHKNDKLMFIKDLEASRKFLEEELDRTMQLYRIRNMAFYLAYIAARRARHHHLKRRLVIPDPETTTGVLELLVLFKDTMEPALGASLVVAQLNISQTTDQDGETYNDELAPGTYQGQLTMEGYQTIDFTFTIEAGKTCDMQFLLEKVS